MSKSVQLRAEARDDGSRLYLDASINEEGALVLSGQDLGPVAEFISEDGEYEYWHVFPASAIRDFLAHVGCNPDGEPLGELKAEWSGPKSYELEQLIRTFDGEHTFTNYF